MEPKENKEKSTTQEKVPTLGAELGYLREQGFEYKDIYKFYLYKLMAEYQQKNPTRTEVTREKFFKPFLREFRKVSSWDETLLQEVEKEEFADLSEAQLNNTHKYKEVLSPIPEVGGFIIPQLNLIAGALEQFAADNNQPKKAG